MQQDRLYNLFTQIDAEFNALRKSNEALRAKVCLGGLTTLIIS